MPSNTTAQDQSGDRNPRRAATAGRQTFRQRLTAMGARLFGSATEPDTAKATPSRRVQKHVLRDYHAANLAAARTASEELVHAGFHTGDVPYGYRAQRARVCPTGGSPRWRTRLSIEPVEASTVQMIFLWRATERLPIKDIRRRLTVARYPAPLDRHTGHPGMWTEAIVRAIVRNPKYLGHQVWGRTHHGIQVPRSEWVWSDTWAHPPVVTLEQFTNANRHSRPLAALRPGNE
ncbi:recombinase [Actinosynnema sp. ALI-1.44]|uniref:recombinase family protein n=1 Tax=Actinosynnema sp. ALI-1.44 TaxID=1933779 RepID=UPI00097C7E2C|nr:recombinase family protein [Actinosynnema sp. ALI-1.44]ONI71114.1 recombinase [Actinosynnema sp. ALI-1.44]